jgi:hypothetical protein
MAQVAEPGLPNEAGDDGVNANDATFPESSKSTW